MKRKWLLIICTINCFCSMITKNAKLLLLCIFVLSFFLLSSCSLRSAENYPLSVDDGGSGKVGCNIYRPGDEWVFGTLFIKNIGKTSITINHVVLTDVKNITTIEISLMEVSRGLLGAAKWPLDSANGTPLSDYSYINERIDAEGAVIQPGEGYNLLVVIESQEDEASASGLIIEYTDAHNKKYEQKSNYGYFLSCKGFENN